MDIESDELIRQLPASLALPYSLLNYRNARLKTVMLCLISCAYQDGFALHIPDYLLPETEAPMLAALTPPSERSYYTSLVLKGREDTLHLEVLKNHTDERLLISRAL